jgi:hypothetical protein
MTRSGDKSMLSGMRHQKNTFLDPGDSGKSNSAGCMEGYGFGYSSGIITLHSRLWRLIGESWLFAENQ